MRDSEGRLSLGLSRIEAEDGVRTNVCPEAFLTSVCGPVLSEKEPRRFVVPFDPFDRFDRFFLTQNRL